MLVFIHAYEDRYQGLHGIEDMTVADVNSIEEANNWGKEMSYEVIESYGMEDEYFEDYDEDEENNLDEYLGWTIMKIKDEYVGLGAKELERIATCITGAESFMKKYCEYIDY